MKIIKTIYRFIRYNKNRKLTVGVLLYSGWIRLCILMLPMRWLERYMGSRGEESPMDEEHNHYLYAMKVSRVVDRVCSKTIWESKCLVRALTAQKFLKRKGIATTLYLGCQTKNEELKAHAWIRCGQFFVTGGNGKDFAMVAKFKA